MIGAVFGTPGIDICAEAGRVPLGPPAAPASALSRLGEMADPTPYDWPPSVVDAGISKKVCTEPAAGLEACSSKTVGAAEPLWNGPRCTLFEAAACCWWWWPLAAAPGLITYLNSGCAFCGGSGRGGGG